MKTTNEAITIMKNLELNTMKANKETKAQRILATGYKLALMYGTENICVFIDSPKYSKKLKLQIIDAANEKGLNLRLDGTKLYNKYTKRYFACNNIVKA
jgi:hypothetical protein